MKQLTNKKVVVGKTRNDKGEIIDNEISFADLVRQAANNIPQGGLDVREMSNRLRLVGAADRADKENTPINLEDSDYNTLKRCVDEMRWVVVSEGIVEFYDTIMEAGKKKKEK